MTDFVAAVTRGGKAKAWFDGGHLSALVTAVFKFVQMTSDDVCITYNLRHFVLTIIWQGRDMGDQRQCICLSRG